MNSRTIISLLAFLYLLVPSYALAGEFTQPIKFSHVTHAGKNEIPCEFCHIYARRSISSGAPPVRTCIGCHAIVKGSDDFQQKEIQKVVDHYEAKKPIEWKKIHDVPDFVHFSHKRHIQKGFDCTECHGNMAKVEEVTMDTMIADLSMGWCVTCHKKEHPVANGKIAGPVRSTRGASPVKNAVAPQADGVVSGSTDCLVCHK